MSPTSRSIVLASRSPRRRALLEAACFAVRVAPQDVDERLPTGDPADGALAVARRKLDALGSVHEVALAADTVVVLGTVALGKPIDRDDAHRMLTQLAGREHVVVTGFCLSNGARRHEQRVATRVRFRHLCAEEIERYIDSGEPFDKAGGYGIQGLGGALVDALDGSYTNVVGLPLTEVIGAWEALA